MIHGKKRNGDLFKRLTESWGYSKPETEEAVPLDEEMAADAETVTEEEEAEEEKVEEGVFDANHYCIHHGGVHHNGSIEMAEAVRHADPDASGHVSHYDMKLADGTILENVAAEDIQVTNATLAKEHMHKRDADAGADDEEEVEEGVFKGRTGNDEDLPNSVARAKKKRRDDAAADADVGYYGRKRKGHAHIREGDAQFDDRFMSKEDKAACAEDPNGEACRDAVMRSMHRSGMGEGIEEGGAAARTGNEDRDQGRERMTTDRIREEEEDDKLEETIRRLVTDALHKIRNS